MLELRICIYIFADLKLLQWLIASDSAPTFLVVICYFWLWFYVVFAEVQWMNRDANITPQ